MFYKIKFCDNGNNAGVSFGFSYSSHKNIATKKRWTTFTAQLGLNIKFVSRQDCFLLEKRK